MPGPEPVAGDQRISRPTWPPPRTVGRARPGGQPAARPGGQPATRSSGQPADLSRLPTVTVTVQVTMTGEDALAGAVELAERLRPLAATVVATPAAPAEPQAWPPLRILPSRFQAELNGKPLPLTRLEYGLLLFLADNPGRVYTRPQLLRAVWDQNLVSGVRTVDVHVRRLRAKLGDAGPMIGTVHGVGYRLDRADRVAVVREAG